MEWVKKGQIFDPHRNLGWIASHAAVPFAKKKEDDLYRIYFSGRDHINRSQTGFFEININSPWNINYITDEPILKRGRIGSFDDSGAMLSWIVDYQDRTYLYYIGWNLGVTVPFRNSMGLAISQDGGKTFWKYSKGPILDRDSCDPYFIASACVLIDGNKWRMWYLSCEKWVIESGKPKHFYHIKYAESDNGIHWKKTGNVCLDFKSNVEYAISRPCVLKEKNLYKMWYSYRGESYRIGYAESKDGIKWERKDEEAGIDVSESGWDSEMIEYPHVFDHKGERFMLYNGNGYGKTGIGLAVLADE